MTRPDDGPHPVRDLLGVVYPPPHVVHLAGAGTSAGPVRARWTAYPSAERARLLLPEATPRASLRMLRRQLTGRRPRTRLARAGLAVATATGLPRRTSALRVEVTAPVGTTSLEDLLREELGAEALRLTLPIGPPRATRKPVLQVTDPDGTVLAWVKVAHDQLTDRLVATEARALRRLADADVAPHLTGVQVPRLLAQLQWSGHHVVVLAPLRIPAVRPLPGGSRARLVSVVAQIAATGPLREIPWSGHPWRRELLTQLDGIAHHPSSVALRREVDSLRSGLTVPTGAWHGDLNPGNLALAAVTPVWDWERYDDAVPLGFDLLHHDLQSGITVAGVPASESARRLLLDAATTLAPLGVPADVAPVIARLYLVSLACRYLADGQAAAGAALGQVDRWLLPSLAQVSP